MPPAHSRKLSPSHLSHRTMAPLRYSVLLSCWLIPTSAPITSRTFTYSARHFRPVALLRLAFSPISTLTRTLFLHFFQPVNWPDSGTMEVRRSGSSAFLAPDRLAPYRSAPDRLAPYRLAPDRLARDRLAPYRLASYRLASYRS